MTPEQFTVAVQGIIDGSMRGSPFPLGKEKHYPWEDDKEEGHVKYDALVDWLLRELGYGEGVALAATKEKWYS